MLVNVKFFKKIFLFSTFILLSTNLYAGEKKKIITQLNDLNSLEFTFNQMINEKNEKGSCLLEFPGNFNKHSPSSSLSFISCWKVNSREFIVLI